MCTHAATICVGFYGNRNLAVSIFCVNFQRRCIGFCREHVVGMNVSIITNTMIKEMIRFFILVLLIDFFVILIANANKALPYPTRIQHTNVAALVHICKLQLVFIKGLFPN